MKKISFSQRYGYTKVEDVIIRECMPKSVLNAILNELADMFCEMRAYNTYMGMEDDFWRYYLNQRTEIHIDNRVTVQSFLDDDNIIWYEKIDLLEWMINYLQESNDSFAIDSLNIFIANINSAFERLNYAYRIIGNQMVEIVSEDEIGSIKETLNSPIDSIKIHIQTALQHISASNQNPDYRNSIKESISAVEVCCRHITGESTLDKALIKLKNKGVSINSQMEQGFNNLYYYTNDKRTGIRHALMVDVNAPTNDEAIYMLVICSAFVNYLTKKGIKE